MARYLYRMSVTIQRIPQAPTSPATPPLNSSPGTISPPSTNSPSSSSSSAAGQAIPWEPWVTPPMAPAPIVPAIDALILAAAAEAAADALAPGSSVLVAAPAAPPEPAVSPEVSPAASVAVASPAAVAIPEVVAPAAPTAPAAPARRVAPEKPKLTPAQKFRIWVGRPLVAVIAFTSLVVVGLPVGAATYTRDSANPAAWRNLSLYEVQGKFQYCFKNPTFSSVFACDYAHVTDVGGLSPRKSRIKRTTILVPYPVAGPVIVDAAPAGTVASSGAGLGAASLNGRPAAITNFPIIAFPAGPMSAIEATCEAAKNAAQNKGAAYMQNVERQCEAAKQAYERAHP